MSVYKIEVVPDDNDTWLITCPILPEVATFTDELSTWQNPARQAVSEALAARIANGQPAPAENATEGEHLLVMPLLTSLKVDLWNAMRSANVTKAELGRRLRVHPPQIDRLLDLNHQSRLEAVADAFRAIEYDLAMVPIPRRLAPQSIAEAMAMELRERASIASEYSAEVRSQGLDEGGKLALARNFAAAIFPPARAR